jgi:hypothetical protein
MGLINDFGYLFSFICNVESAPETPKPDFRRSQLAENQWRSLRNFQQKKTYRRGLNVFDMININIPAIISHKS